MSATIMRAAEPKDMPELIERHRQQCERDGTRYPFPEIFDEDGHQSERYPLALVVEHAGKIDGAIVYESRGVEMMLLGCRPRLTLMAERERNGILYTLRGMGFRWIRALVTKSIVKDVEATLKATGFRRDDRKFASFFKEI
jgi:hypothetical protein